MGSPICQPPRKLVTYEKAIRKQAVKITNAEAKPPYSGIGDCVERCPCHHGESSRQTNGGRLGARTLLGAPGIATRSKDATRGSWHRD